MTVGNRSWLCGNILAEALTHCIGEASSECDRFVSGERLCPDCRHEWLNAEEHGALAALVDALLLGSIDGKIPLPVRRKS